MSFSREVKEELAKQISKSRHCQLAELAAILAMEGQLVREPLTVLFSSENPLLMEKYAVLLKRAFGIERAEPGKDALTGDEASRVLAAVRMTPAAPEGAGCPEAAGASDAGKSTESGRTSEAAGGGKEERLAGRRVDGLLVQNTCCKRAFIRGAFLASGSISDPSKSYHFEIVCHSLEQAEQLKQIINSFELDAKIVSRKKKEIVYLKEGAQIVDMLNVMEASISLMNLENVRIIKEMRNTLNRKVNCETANIGKTVSASVRQIEDIQKIQRTIGFDRLSPALREMALLRLEYPDAPLKDLGSYLEPPVGKSGVNHRLRKLSAIAEKL